MIEPDVRELLFYDLNNMLSIEPDFVPHYFSILIDKFKVLTTGNEYYPLPICEYCGSTDFIEYEGKFYCMGNVVPDMIYDEDKQEMITKSITIINPKEEHNVKEQFVMPYINKVLMGILRKLQEPNGYIMNLYVLESYMFRTDTDDFFETVEGDIRKAYVLMELYKIRRVVSGYMGVMRTFIRFTAQTRAPSIRT